MELNEVCSQVLDELVSLNETNDEDLAGCQIYCAGVACSGCPMQEDDDITLRELREEQFRRGQIAVQEVEPEYTGGSSSYYSLEVKNTTSGGAAYTAECNDIIEALGMNFAEGNAFKALWRRAAQRTLGKVKKGADADGLYDAEKVEFFGARLVAQSKAVRSAE